ncbi:MAG: S41 family peptidase [Oscillospiraceae bacterium]|nr:S41 family peptidase [Oscillospiraceae bacterium]
MNHKISLGVTISICAIVCALTFIITSFFSLRSFNEKVQAVKEKAEKYERLEALDLYVREHYYLADIDEEGVMDGILKGYVAGLGDPYSNYMTAEEYAAQNEKESGKSVGIGVSVTQNDDGLPELVEIYEDSPADEAGLQVGDVLTSVDGKTVEELGYEEAIDRVRGDEGTEVVLTFDRAGRSVTFHITRASFDVKSVSAQLMDDGIGYIRIRSFRENTAEQFSAAVDEMVLGGAESLLFDVRSNGGGLLEALEKMLDPLLPEGVIATATYQDGTTETVVYSDAEEIKLPMVILVDGGTASAAELFSASLRDFKDAKLVGTQTYGKGVMQVTRRMEDGGGLKLTVATYQTTRSDCYNGVGLEPDLIVEPDEDTVVNDADPEHDPALAAALEMLTEEDTDGRD